MNQQKHIIRKYKINGNFREGIILQKIYKKKKRIPFLERKTQEVETHHQPASHTPVLSSNS